jgi:2-amino-4-hydroxy-6-hydroxymethyldihydropteridine diphosphokinase
VVAAVTAVVVRVAAYAGADGAGLRILPEAATVVLWRPAYIAVGSNVEGPRAQVLKALDALRALATTKVVLVSRLYETKPFGPVAQPDFVNAVAGVLTQLDARALLDALKTIETTFGRPTVHEKWGPRVIDLDLLVYGRERIAQPGLTVPHPGIPERNFVLYPLADIAPDLDVPGLGRVAGLQARVAPDGVKLLATS